MTEQAFSLLELLVALVLVGMMLALSVDTLHQAQVLRRYIDRVHQQTLAVTTLSKEIQRSLDDFDTHGFPQFLKIHESGRIDDSEGNPLPITIGVGKYSPHPNSQAFSSMAVDLRHLLQVRDISLSTTWISMKACRRYLKSGAPLPSPSKERSYIGITTMGMFEFSGTRTSLEVSTGCTELQLHPTTGIFTSRPKNHEVLAVRALLPVSRSYTLYLTHVGELRYLGHLGAMIIENQPLLAAQPDLHFTIAESRHHENFKTLSLSVKFRNRFYEQCFVHRRSEQTGLDLLLTGDYIE